MKAWLATVDSTAFWKQISRTEKVVTSRIACSLCIDNMIIEETPSPTPTTPWMIGDANMNNLFKKYCDHIDTIDHPLYLETSLKELLAFANILFLVPQDHSPKMINIFGQKTLDNACEEVLEKVMPATTPKINDTEFLKVVKASPTGYLIL